MSKFEQLFDFSPEEEKGKRKSNNKFERFEYRKLFEGQKIETEKENNEIILEVGAGTDPYFISENGTINKNQHYIGIDVSSEDIKEAKKNIKKIIKVNPECIRGKVDFLITSGEAIPLKDKSVNKLIFRDVFGAPDSYFDYKLLKPNTKEFWENNNVKAAIDQARMSFVREKNPELAAELIRYYSISLFTLKEQLKNNKSFKQLNEGEQLVFMAIDRAYNKINERIVKMNFINEASRVLKDYGVMRIIESRTPDIAQPWIDYLSGRNTHFSFFNKEVRENKKIKNSKIEINCFYKDTF